jgi:hypothetical protein
MHERQQEKLDHLTAYWPNFTEAFGEYIHGTTSIKALEETALKLEETLRNNLELHYTRYLGEHLLDDMLELGGAYIMRTFQDIDFLKPTKRTPSDKREERLSKYYDRFEERLAQLDGEETLAACAAIISGAIYDVTIGEIPPPPIAARPIGSFTVRTFQWQLAS